MTEFKYIKEEGFTLAETQFEQVYQLKRIADCLEKMIK
jgi:hypothetical protein